MACACKAEKEIAEYNKKQDKIVGKRKTISDVKEMIISGFLTIILKLFAIVFAIVACPIIMFFVLVKILIGSNKITVKIPNFLMKWYRNRVKADYEDVSKDDESEINKDKV